MAYADIEQSEQDQRPVELYWVNAGSKQIRFCNLDTDVTYQGSVFSGGQCRRTELKESNDTSDGAMTIWVPRTSELALMFLGLGVSALPKITLYRGHLNADLKTVDSDNAIVIFNGRITNPTTDAVETRLQCRSLMADLATVGLTQKFSNNCPYFLYRKGCEVNRALFTDTYTVTANNGEVITLDMPPKVADYYTGGLLSFGVQHRMITAYNGTQNITLIAGIEDLAIGDSVQVSAGCDRTRQTCRDRFNNYDKFGGWGFIPTINYFEAGLG